MTRGDDAGFAALTRQIARGAGVSVDVYKDKCLRRRIAVRMRACGARTYAEYQAVLERTPAEYERLKDALTINVTRFFRNPETWERLRTTHLAALWDAVAGPQRWWSAGCASGEEAYTLVLLAADLVDARATPAALDRLRVDATDIDRQSLARAEAARYAAPALVEMPPAAARYLERDGDAFIVPERLRRRVAVREHDLSRDPPPARIYHLIACRNVVIYFDRPMQERLFLTFAEALAPGGLLLLGKVETLVGPARDRLVLLDARERLWQRPR